MQKFDAALLAQHLNTLAEVYERKAVAPKALEVWFEALKEFPTEYVCDVLLNWAKLHPKFPAPSEVWKVVNERSIQRRENQQQAERDQFAREEKFMGATPQGRAIIAELRKMLAVRTSTSIAERMREKIAASGKPAFACQLDYLAAVEAKRVRADVVEREPGQDDEESNDEARRRLIDSAPEMHA